MQLHEEMHVVELLLIFASERAEVAGISLYRPAVESEAVCCAHHEDCVCFEIDMMAGLEQ